MDHLEVLQVDLRFTIIISGEQSVVICSIMLLLLLHADSLDTLVSLLMEQWTLLGKEKVLPNTGKVLIMYLPGKVIEFLLRMF